MATDKSYIGKGKVHLDGRFLGNVSVLDFTINEENIELTDYTSAGGGNYNSVRRIDSVEMSMTAHDLSAENLAVALFGSTSSVTSSAIVDESITAGAVLDTLIRPAEVIDTAVSPVVTSDPAGTTYVEDTDYIVSAAGITPIVGGGISASDPLLIDYTSKANDVVQALTTSAQEFELIFDGLNEAQSGTPVIITVYRAKFGGAQGLSMIGDEFAEIALTGDVLKDTTIIASNLSQYMKIESA